MSFSQAIILVFNNAAIASSVLGGGGFAATFTFNAAFTNTRLHIYESEQYAETARRVVELRPGADPTRSLNVLGMLTRTFRCVSPAMAAYGLIVPKIFPDNAWAAGAGLFLMAVWAICLVLWLIVMGNHQKYESRMTKTNLENRCNQKPIDTGLKTAL